MKISKGILVVIPHSGIKRPKEIKKEWLSEYNYELIHTEDCETDRGTKELYNFRKILGNKQLTFPVRQIYINICRHPKKLNESVPLLIRNTPVYKKGKELSVELRKKLLEKYYFPFYKKITNAEKTIILNGHSMIAGHESLGAENLKEDIVISDWEKLNGKLIKFAPKELADFYASELRKRLPNLKIGRNSVYTSYYDHICAIFGTDKKTKEDNRVPVIHQETLESLYMEGNKVNGRKLEILRKAFAESLLSTVNYYKLS